VEPKWGFYAISSKSMWISSIWCNFMNFNASVLTVLNLNYPDAGGRIVTLNRNCSNITQAHHHGGAARLVCFATYLSSLHIHQRNGIHQPFLIFSKPKPGGDVYIWGPQLRKLGWYRDARHGHIELCAYVSGIFSANACPNNGGGLRLPAHLCVLNFVLCP